eukprot:GEMP01069186.1.p1 GENE.GEMP01069186.1~~GEMP01069186.1.p1  ORF type:complete len:289 (+),score=92.18 GEMP01069186.1:31-897(+)
MIAALLVFLTAQHVLCQTPEHAAAQAQSEAAFARGTASEVGAEEASRKALSSSDATASAAESVNMVKPVIEGTAREGHLREQLATKDEEAAREALEAVGIASQHAIDSAGQYAAKLTEDKLASVYQKMQEWKMAVLHNPISESKQAAERASRPYHRAMMKIEKRINEYQQRATSLNDQAFGLQNTAQSLAATAVAKQAALDFTGAQKDMMDAHQMMAQAAQFGQQAFKLQEQAKALQINIPAYQASAQMSAAAAAHRYDSEHVAPPPVSPSAFNPPPPPTNVFLQIKQ